MRRTKLMPLLFPLLLTAIAPLTFAQEESEFNWAPGGNSLQWMDPTNWNAGDEDGPLPGGNEAVVNIGAGLPAFLNGGGGGDILLLNIGDNARLDIETGFLSFGPRTAARPFSMQNAGTLNVLGSTAEIHLRDQVANFTEASINLDDGGKIRIVDGDTTINTSNVDAGNGLITMGANTEISGSGGATFTFEKQTIQGQGSIGANSIGLRFDADTIVEANVAGSTLTVDAAAGLGLVNGNVMKATNGGILDIRGAVTNTGGLIEAEDGSEVSLSDTFDITGGILRRSGTGTFSSSGSGRLANLTLDNTNINVGNAGNLLLVGAIENSGDIALTNTNTLTDLQIDDGVVLTGGGTVTLGGAFDFSRITDDNGGGILTNIDNTIRGRGLVGDGKVQINNAVGGTIDANNSSGSLILGPVNGSAMVNRGLMKASGGGNLIFASGEYDNVDGLVDLQDGSTIRLNTGSNITGGTVQNLGTGSFVMGSTGSLTDLTTQGTIDVDNAENLKLTGTINNLGDISVMNTNTLTDLQIDTAASLTGGGTVTLGGTFGFSRITDDDGGGVLTNVDNTIRGQGLVGNGQIQIINEAGGTLDGNDSSGSLAIGGASSSASINRGLFTASNGGDLLLTEGDFDNSAGLIEPRAGSSVTVGGTAVVAGGILNAADGSTINFTGSGKVVDATLQSAGTGKYEVLSGTGVIEDVVNESSITVKNNANLGLVGSIANSGDIAALNTNTLTDLQIDEGVVLTGGGTVTLGGEFNFSRITDDDGVGTLTNVDNTIRGQGLVGNGRVKITNEGGGTIDANDSTGSLVIGSVSGATMVNRGLMTASNEGNLVFAAGEYDNAGGTIDVQDDSTITFNSGSNITGGTVQSLGSGSFDMVSTGSFTDLTTNGTINVNNGDNLKLTGAINNLGDISAINTNTLTDIQVDTAASLTGGGKVTLGGVFGFSRITDDDGGGVLTNVDNTIRGQGLVGNGLVNVENLVLGVIQSDQTGSNLVVDSAAATFDNFGTLSAINNSVLDVLGTTNNLGVVDAQAGSRVEFETLINGASGELTGDGTIEALAEIVNNGTISPGNSPGQLILDSDLELVASSILEIELADLTMFDELVVNGDVELGGVLELALLDGYTPGEMDVFDVVMASGMTGFFDNVADGARLVTVDGAGSFQVNYGSGGTVQLSQFTAVPEPGSAVLIVAVWGGVLLRRRRCV